MDSQLPAGHPDKVFGLLSKKSLATIKAVRAKAVAELLMALSRYWESVGVSMAALKQHDPAELIPVFERYAERQFDSYAEELLPHLSDVDKYAWHLATDVIDRISNEIRPAAGFMPRDVLSGEWTELARLLKESKPDVRREMLDVLSDPSGEWEIYIGRAFRRHLVTHNFRRKDNPDGERAAQLLSLLFQLKYHFHLRLFLNWYDFDLKLRAHLSNRLAYWQAQAYQRAIPQADEAEIPKLAPVLVMGKNGTDRRKAIDGFISKLADAGHKISRKHIWSVAGYKDRTEFERFQRGDTRTTKSATASFNRVLNMKPEDFIRALEKKISK
ncbi:MAG: hypothetical protein ACLQVN_00125 [Bryobacteraceae bacterium]